MAEDLDFRVAVSLFKHPKFLKLKKALGPDACLALLTLWGFARASRPKGILTNMDDLDIAVAAGWEGDPEAFVFTLIQIGWLDGGNQKNKRLHDWKEHQSYSFFSDRRVEIAKLAAKSRWNKRLSAMREACSEHAGSMHGAMLEDAGSNAPSPTPSPSPTPDPKEKELVGKKRRPASEASPEGGNGHHRKPLSEHEGAVGECARAWRTEFGSEMTAAKEDIINFHRKRDTNRHLKDHVFAFAFKLMLRDPFWKEHGASFGAFVRNFDKYLSLTELEKGDYAEPA